ncbi:MAG TPA: phospholipid carrier-dependent glycosyltransferase [Candidatus Limnocylindrales bacterium]|nr:phospholipid carrier-dependent glycosyltransferase [Candidatus Limnocylindrales bacterium]
MTARDSGVPSRGAGAPTRTTWTRDGVGAILFVLALGLAFRLIIAQVNPGSGFEADLTSFTAWASNLADEGLYGFYERPFFHDYTPGYLYVLWLVGTVGRALGEIGDLIKLPAIVADVALGWLVWSMVRELGGGARAALVGAALVVANPVSWFDSVVWGQVDSFGVVFLLLALRELWRDRPERAAILTVIAALIKPQLGILIPIVALVTIRRALVPEGGHGRPDPEADVAAGLAGESDEPGTGEPGPVGILDRVRTWERRTDRPIRIVTTGIAAVITTYALCLPFGLSVLEIGDGGLRSGLVEQIFKTAGGYPYVSVNAYNPWALAEIDGTGVAANGGWICDTLIANPVPGGPTCPVAFTVGPLPAVVVGTALLVAAFALVGVVVAVRPDRLTLLVGVAVLAIAFFVLPTRVHERYMFPFFALGAILAAFSWRWLVAYIVLSAATFMNMYVVLTTLYPDNPGIEDWLRIGAWGRSAAGVTVVAIANLGAALWAFAQLRPRAREALRDELVGWDADVPDEAGGEAFAAPAAPYRTSAPDAAAPAAIAVGAGPLAPALEGRGGAVATARPSSADHLPAWSERPSFAELGIVGWFRSKLAERPIRADRSHALHGEPTGRLDRLDLWLLVVLLVATFGLRTFRLAEPYQMHFDEVYHARTATEFLQAWRYGISHDIYEWTHPHLAKYAMAGGIVAWGDNRVSATSELGVPVVDAVVEPRRDDPSLPGSRAGDRLHVATGSGVRAYDLETRQAVLDLDVPGASALAVDSALDRLFIGTADGRILVFELFLLDGVGGLETADTVGDPTELTMVDGPIARMYASDDGRTLLVATPEDRLIALDAESAEVVGGAQLEGIAQFAPGGSGPALTALPEGVADPAAAASVLAELIGGDAATYEDRLAAAAEGTVIAGFSGSDRRADLEAAIADGRLAGLAIEDVPRIAIATAEGVTFVATATGDVVSTTEVDGGAHGLAWVDVDGPKLYVSTGGSADDAPGEVAVIAIGGDQARDGPSLQRTLPLPGAGGWVAYNDATQMVHVLGTAPSGEGRTIYVIETHANAVFADATLPFEPAAWAPDFAKRYPSDDRQQILAIAADGTAASVETGRTPFAWRLPGVIAGALMALLMYVLTRLLFRRREVAILVGIFALVDGMLFVQSRIGMNDAYVALGIVAAYTLFGALWSGAWRRPWAFWLAMPLIGLSLGLALAAKWVALYAIGGLGILVLARSALGRLLLVGGLIAITGILGHLALAVPAGSGGLGNLPFVAIMIGLTSIAVVVNVLHPIAWSDDEVRFAVGAPTALGAAVALGAIALGRADEEFVLGPVAVTPLHLAAALVLLSVVAYGGFVMAGRLGFGPFAAPPDPTDPAALLPPAAPPPRESWLRPGALLGLPIAWMAICLVVLPLGLYVASYVPWALVEGHRITETWPPGHEGQTLVELTRSMYDYHNNLTAGHAASSPWWAWPLNLKPVWFYQEGLAGSTTAAIYDAGNLVVWWFGIPAMAFVAWQAYARRSLGLALIAIAFACQWVSWARIDRAAFQYHYYTSLPFVIMGLAYFASELWHGTSRRIWLFARIAAAVAVLGPGLLWVFSRPFCGFVGVGRTQDPPDSQPCPPFIPEFVVTWQTLGLAIVVLLAILVFLRQLAALDSAEPGRSAARHLAPLGITALAALVGLVVVRFLPTGPVIEARQIPVEPLAIVLSLPLVVLAAFVATARDARRFVVGLVSAAAAWFVVVYPNISALPLPTVIANAYQGVLPTYLYLFQFPTNRTEVTEATPLLDPVAGILAGALLLLSVVLAYSAWIWRIALAEREADAAAPPTDVTTGSPAS